MKISPALAGLVLAVCLIGAVPSDAAAQDQEYVLPQTTSTDFNSILNNRSTQVTVFEYAGRSLIRIIDFPTLTEQGRMFNRVVALIERIGAPRERVLTNEELAGFIRSVGKTENTFAYGNDFLVAELVVFFNLADLGGIQLNAEEIALRRFLLEQRLITYRNGFYQSITPQAVILSIPQESDGSRGTPPVSAMARRTILTHEISHAEFYTNPLYANYCRQFWRTVMTEDQRTAFRKFLSKSSYNPDNEEMMVNESQAYLIYTPDPRAFNAKLLGMKDKDIEALRVKFWAGFPDAPLAELKR